MLVSQNNSQKRSHKKKRKKKKEKRKKEETILLIFIKIVEKFEKPLGYYLLQMHNNPRFILHTNSPRGLKICKNKNLKLLKIIF
jgi:hypothetical protein